MRHINYIKLAVFLGIAFTGSCLISQVSYASDNKVSLTASPAIVDTGGEAGAEIPFSFQLTNNGDTILPIHMSARDSRVREGQAEEFMRALSAKDWVTFTEPDFILVAGETRKVNGTLHIPAGTNPGGHYTDLIVQSLSQEKEDGIIATQPELAVQMFISVGGNIEESLSVANEGPSSMLLNRSASNTLSFTIKNNGNVHTLFTPKLYLINRKSTIIVDSRPEILLPGERKNISFTIPTSTQLRVYSAQVKFTYGTPGKDATGPEMRIIILPFSPKLLFIIPLLVATLYAYRVRRRIILAVQVIAKGGNTSLKK